MSVCEIEAVTKSPDFDVWSKWKSLFLRLRTCSLKSRTSSARTSPSMPWLSRKRPSCRSAAAEADKKGTTQESQMQGSGRGWFYMIWFFCVCHGCLLPCISFWCHRFDPIFCIVTAMRFSFSSFWFLFFSIIFQTNSSIRPFIHCLWYLDVGSVCRSKMRRSVWCIGRSSSHFWGNDWGFPRPHPLHTHSVFYCFSEETFEQKTMLFSFLSLSQRFPLGKHILPKSKSNLVA